VTESLSTKPSTYTDPKTFQTNRLCQEKNSLWCNFGDTLCLVSGQLNLFLKHAVGHQRNKKCLFLKLATAFDFQVSIGSTKKHLAFIVGAVSCFLQLVQLDDTWVKMNDIIQLVSRISVIRMRVWGAKTLVVNATTFCSFSVVYKFSRCMISAVFHSFEFILNYFIETVFNLHLIRSEFSLSQTSCFAFRKRGKISCQNKKFKCHISNK